MPSAADPAALALAELRRARQRQRLADIHWVDALYHVYVAAILAIVALIAVSSLVGGGRVDAAGLARVHHSGPALLGLVASLAVLVGLRSGSRGGPVALEAPDVRHVLLSPVDRGHALRGPALKQLRFLVFSGAVVGGAAGVFAHRRLDHNPAAFVGAGAAYGVAVVLLAVGSALVVSGRRLPRWLATSVGLALVAWSAADLADRFPSAPLSFLGRLALWPLHVELVALVPVAVGVGLTALGLAGLGGLSIEHAERRTRLVGQLRFAVTLQDLRTVLVLRRQLSLELPRERPWFARPGRVPRPPRSVKTVVWRRGWWGVRRFPASRLVRLLIAAVVAGVAARAVWDGTLPLVVLAGLALWVAALDAIEPLAQETDHPSRRDSYACDVGELMARHLAVPAVVMVVVGAFAAGTFVLLGPSRDALQVGALWLVPGALGATAGAVVSALMGAPRAGADVSVMLPPEIAGMKNALRAGWPPMLAVAGSMPVFAARLAVEKNVAFVPVVREVAGAVVVLAVLVAGWVRFREDIHAYWKRTMDEAKQMQDEKAKAAATRSRRDDEEGA